MSAIEHLKALARGDTPPDDGLLGNARCGWGGGELVGAEAINAAFCARPFDDSETITVETQLGVALIGPADALIADCYNNRIGRLWRVGKGVARPHEPAIDLAFDPDMSQQRGVILFDPDDHPALAPGSADRLLEAARGHLEALRRSGALRTRAFVVRAFGDDDAAAALLAIYTMGNEISRTTGFGYAIVGTGRDIEPHIVGDDGPSRPWTPRF